MHGSSGSGTGKKARIEIIPLIDVIFFLLATFVLFTLSLNRVDGLPVQLPVAATGEPRNAAEENVTISVTTDGTIAWNKDQITLNEFIARLVVHHREAPQSQIHINGDSRAFFSQAIYVFDEARKAGFNRVFIETKARVN
jgi:biopolymer transport protein ExbD